MNITGWLIINIIVNLKITAMATNQKSNPTTGRQPNQGSQNRSSGSNKSGDFANMDDNKQREMAGKGGKASNSGGSNKSH